ncbi:mannosyl-3-phosphoglycerate synthase [Mangrovihabitans endophyticus]|uniref:Mannosyl-3-phosphoglycerate synthase n=1 Tax=Mangrovihabitans endophyticus TaxID=1751298 RepID=A0A8J3FRP5_9ACTN|nr:mannosyl-3-phosphoglycerate synthase [Mangrovihabitans endophyticus]GGL11095.1 mannosyl-3-phosphoglycerate synthase [Mangrovihabitans endophyticus]
MRLADSFRSERFGAVRIHELQRVIELDSGAGDHAGLLPVSSAGSRVVPPEALRAVENEMVIVVPCMNETRSVIEGVLSGVPHDCLIVLVSNSDRLPVDRYEIEAQTVEQFCRLAGRSAVTVHQKDPGLAAAFKAAGMAELIADDGLVRNGKGEAMLIGMALAAMTGRKYLGYVDADNYVPGAVHEYCKAYAAGLHLANSPFSMVRISWHSKPKLKDGRLFFSRKGRSSAITNDWLNRFLAEYSGFGTEVIATGNAGEHAMSMELGLKLRLAGGFAVEPFEYMDLFEQFGGLLENPNPDVMAASVPVLQIETRNPHFHDNKGEEHVQGMRMQALNVLYHSAVTLPSVRQAIIEFMVAQGALETGQEPPRERVYPPVGTLALDLLYDALDAEAQSFREFDGRSMAGLPQAPPIERGRIPGMEAPRAA